ncbi:MAG: glycosyl hydrolase [Gammaproteobacteria bacterium]|nr:glycosyl hydrolase [Gammaproteobacteria bacterium]
MVLRNLYDASTRGYTGARWQPWWRTVMIGIAVLLAACEAPLNVSGVDAAAREPIRRSDLLQAAARSDEVIVVVGNHGLLLRSTDGGETWQRRVLANWPSLIDVTACGNGLFAALAAEGEVWTSGDGGVTWAINRLETEEAPQALTCDPRNRLWVVGSFGTVIDSADGGHTWTDHSRGEDLIFNHIQFLDTDTALVLGEFGAVVWSRDGGATWQGAEHPLPDEFYPLSAWFENPARGWVAGISGQILYTDDGGTNWQRQPTGTIVPLYALAPLAGTLYALGGEGTILRLEGTRWVRVEHGRQIRLHLRAHLNLDDERLLVGGAAGSLHILRAGELSASAAANSGS